MLVTFVDGTHKYACDWCKRNFSHEEAAHITLVIGDRSGIAKPPPNQMPGWRMSRLFRPTRLHFCMPGESACVLHFLSAIVQDNAELPEYVR